MEETMENLLENPACAEVEHFWRWYNRRVNLIALTRKDSATPSTNNIAEARHRSWLHAGGYHLSLGDAVLFQIGEAMLSSEQAIGMLLLS